MNEAGGGGLPGGGTVSVIIPTRNRAPLVRRAVQSALWQTHADLEVIVVDDASTDATAGVVARIGDPRVRYLRHDSSRGAAAARNTGIRQARGAHIAFLDDDDIWLPEKLEKQLQCFRNAGEPLGAVHCGFLQWQTAPPYRAFVPSGPWTIVGDVWLDLLGFKGSVLPSTLVVSATVIDDVGGFDEELLTAEDTDLIMRIGTHYRFGFVPETLAIYYDTPDSLMKNDAVVVEMRRRLLAKHKDLYAKHPDLYAQLLAEVGAQYLHRGDLDRAAAMIEQARRLDPGNVLARRLALRLRYPTLWRLGSRAKALARTLVHPALTVRA